MLFGGAPFNSRAAASTRVRTISSTCIIDPPTHPDPGRHSVHQTGGRSPWHAGRRTLARPHMPRPTDRCRTSRREIAELGGRLAQRRKRSASDRPSSQTIATRPRNRRNSSSSTPRQNLPCGPAPFTTKTCVVRGSSCRMSSTTRGKSLPAAAATSLSPSGSLPRYRSSTAAKRSGTSGNNCDRCLRAKADAGPATATTRSGLGRSA